MNTTIKSLVAGLIAVATLSTASAWAARPDICRADHDHRSHATDYYNYYPADSYYRAGPYRDSGVSFSITFGNDRSYNRSRDNRARRYDDRGRRNGYRGREGRIVNRQVFQTRYRARIVLVEEVVRTRNGPRLLCTVDARGREAGYVPRKRLKRVARRNCSDRSRIRIVA